MANKPNILANFKKGRSIGAVDNFVDTMNWLVGFVANLKTDTGIEIKNQQSDHPTIKAKVIAGDGIKVEESGGAWKISLDDGGDDDDDGSNKGGKKGSGGSGNGGSSGQGGSGGNGGGQGGGASGGGSGGTSGDDNTTGGSKDKDSDCNQFSEEIENEDSDDGMDNAGDLCSELNGW
jgi:hypothetical protein